MGGRPFVLVFGVMRRFDVKPSSHYQLFRLFVAAGRGTQYIIAFISNILFVELRPSN